jgi:RecJ-like exonuclease
MDMIIEDCPCQRLGWVGIEDHTTRRHAELVRRAEREVDVEENVEVCCDQCGGTGVVEVV